MDERVLVALDPRKPWSTYLVQPLRGDERAMKMPMNRSNGRASAMHVENLEAFLKARQIEDR